MTKSPQKKMSGLESAANKTPDVEGCFKIGLQALESRDRDRRLIAYEDAENIQGSIYLDKSTEHLYHDKMRWDYVIEYAGKLYYYEPHPAVNSANVDEICGKANWLRWWLKNKAPEMAKLGGEGFFWIHTGACNVTHDSTLKRKLSVLGVSLRKQLIMR